MPLELVAWAVFVGVLLIGGGGVQLACDWLDRRDDRLERERNERLRRMYRRRAAWDAIDALGPFDH